MMRNQDDEQVQLKKEIDRGIADVREGRRADFRPGSVIALGKKLSAERAKSGSQKTRK
jgi:hypothetical protein